MIKETEVQNTYNYRIDNAKRASNCQLNCFEYHASIQKHLTNEAVGTENEKNTGSL